MQENNTDLILKSKNILSDCEEFEPQMYDFLLEASFIFTKNFAAWDFVLESVKTIEKENEALKSKLKYEEEKFVNETAEKVSMKRQLLLQQKEILKLKKEALYLPSKKKSVVQQFQISDKNSDNGGEDRTSNSFEMKDCDLESLNIIESDKFYGFSEEEAVIAISSVSKLLLDKLVVDEEAFIEALECELDETCKRTMFEKIQDDE